MHIIRRTAILLAAHAAAIPAFAQSTDARPAPSPEQAKNMTERMAERFKTADADHDGKLTLEEAKAGLPVVARNFDKIDTEHAGSVTLEQVTAAAGQMRRNR